MGDDSDHPIIYIYRHAEYDYKDKGVQNLDIDNLKICKCPCGPDSYTDSCIGLDTIRYDYIDEHRQKHAQCLLCEGIVHVLKQQIQTLNGNISSVLEKGKNTYEKTKKRGLTSIQNGIDALTQKRALFEAQAQKIRALKQKIHVATEVLHTATGKLSHLSSSFNTLEQQNGLQYQDTVQVGIPYLPPFFTLSNRNYVIMMVCINVLLLIAIVVYAFMNRVRTDFDVVSTDSNNKPAVTLSKAELKDNAKTTNTVNRTRGGYLNGQDNHPNSLSGMNGHLYQ